MEVSGIEDAVVDSSSMGTVTDDEDVGARVDE